MKRPIFLLGFLMPFVCSVLGCGEGDSDPPDAADAGSSGDASASDAAGDAADAAQTTCGPKDCENSSRCKNVPYDTCGLVDDVCSCSISCLENGDGGTNCPGNAPCKTSAEGTKYCSATSVQ